MKMVTHSWKWMGSVRELICFTSSLWIPRFCCDLGWDIVLLPRKQILWKPEFQDWLHAGSPQLLVRDCVTVGTPCQPSTQFRCNHEKTPTEEHVHPPVIFKHLVLYFKTYHPRGGFIEQVEWLFCRIRRFDGEGRAYYNPMGISNGNGVDSI